MMRIITVYSMILAVVDGIFWEIYLRDLVGEEMQKLPEGSPHRFRYAVDGLLVVYNSEVKRT